MRAEFDTKPFRYVAMLYVVKFNSNGMCVDVVRCVLRVEFCLDRAHKCFQDGVISDPVSLGRDSYPGVAGCGRPFFAFIPS
jgi:hypothetical protein